MAPQPFHSRDFAYTADGDAIEPSLSSPPLSSPGTSARFEFETGSGNNGTKILMVEWPSTKASQTTVYWESMPTGGVLSVNDSNTSSSERRLFLLPAYSPVPRMVYITNDQESLQTNPLPAIYQSRSYESGRKGVLHTSFARIRLRDLEAEIEREASMNTESVALEMALQEKSWIEQEYFLPQDARYYGKKEKNKSKKTPCRSPANSSSRDGKIKPIMKYEETHEEEEEAEESGDDLFAVNLSPRKPDDMLSPYSMRTHDYVPWR